jgi:hypothetical protein
LATCREENNAALHGALRDEIDFVDGDEPSDDVVQNYKKHLAETVQDAAQNLSLRTIKGAGSEKAQVEEIKAEL